MSLTWTARDSNRTWCDIKSSSDGTILYAAGGNTPNASIYKSVDSGNTWSPVLSISGTSVSPANFLGVACSSNGAIVYACTGVFSNASYYGARFYKSTDYGSTWSIIGQMTDGTNYSGVSTSNDGTKVVWYSSNLSGIFVSTNSGSSFTSISISASPQCVIFSPDGTKLIYGLWNGSIYISDNNGTSWNSNSGRAPTKGWKGIASSTNGSIIAAVSETSIYSGGLFISTNSGFTWTLSNAPSADYTGVAISSTGSTIAIIGYGTIAVSTNSNVSWNTYTYTTNWWQDKITMSSSGSNIAYFVRDGKIYTGALYSAPSAPTSVSAVAGVKQASVSFTAPTSNGGAAITSYTVTSTPGSITATGSASPITVSGLTAGTSYTFKVKATNAQNLTSSDSTASTAVTVYDFATAPTTPSTVSGDMDITVSWTAPSNGGSAITGYKLRYSSNGGSSWGAATSVGNVLTYNVPGLTDNTNYQFQVAATNAAGDSAWSTATANVQTVTTPSAPQNVTLTAQQAAIKVDWEAPSNNGGSAITGYTIRYRIQGTVPLTTVDNISPQNTSTTKTYTLTGLTGGSLYDVYVYAFNAIDLAKQGAAAYASATPYDVPGAPQAVSAISGNGYVEISFTDAADNGAPIIDYIISTPGKDDVTGTMSPILFGGLTNGQQYTFTIKANNAAGDGPTATVVAIPINPAAITIDTSSITVTSAPQAAQVVESLSSASAAVVEEVAKATVTQVAANASVSAIMTAAKNMNAAISSTSVKQAVAKAAGRASVSTSISTAATVAEKLTEYKARIADVKTTTVADVALAPLVQDTVQGAAKAILATSEAADVKVVSVLVTGNSETGANRINVKNATVAAIEEQNSASSIPISGDVLSELKASIPAERKSAELASVTSLNVLVANSTTKVVELPVRGMPSYIPMTSGVAYTFGNSLGSETATLTFNAETNTMTKDGTTFAVGSTLVINGVEYPFYAIGSAAFGAGTIQPTPIEVNLNVEISANGTLSVLGYSPTTPSNLVIATNTLPVDALYDSSNGIALIEFWEPDNLDDIEAQLASTQTLGGVEGYKITAKKLALGLQNVLIGELDAKSAEPFNAAPKYGAAGAQNGNRVMTGFGRLALMAYAHYIMGHVQATAAITNDTDFMQGMLSLNSDTLTDYKYANIGNYDAAAAPWSTAGTPTDANLAVRLVKALLDANTSSSLVSNGATNSVANIVNQVIGQDASRATDEDNNKYSPENHGLLRFYPDDIIYVSINLTTPVVNVGTGQLVSDETLQDLYTNATGDKKYTLKITLGPASA